MKMIIVIIALSILISTSIKATECDESIISYAFKGAELKTIFEFALGQDDREIVGFDIVPNKTIKYISGKKVSAFKLEKKLLKCTGLKVISIDYYYKIVMDENFEENTKDLLECRFIYAN